MIEKAVLGSMLWNKQCLEKGMRFLKIDDFQDSNSCKLFSIMKEMFLNNITPNLVMINDVVITRFANDEKEGFMKYLLDTIKTESVSAHFDSYILSLLEKSKRVKLRNAGALLQDYSGDKGKEVNAIIKGLESKIQEISTSNIDVANLDEFSDVEDLQSSEKDFLKTGFDGIDDLTYGLSKGELVILAARPSVGKTALALNIARNVAETKGVLFYSLEMSRKDLSLRLLAAECEVNMNRIKFNITDEHELKSIKKSYEVVKKLNLHINDSSSLSVVDISNLSMQYAKDKNVDFIVVDYLTLVKTKGNENRYLQIGEMTRGFKRLAKDMGVPVLLLSQLGRGVETREKQKPRLSDLRESGDIEQDADKVIFLYKPDKESEEVEVVVAKNRNGATGVISLKFLDQFTKFVEWKTTI